MKVWVIRNKRKEFRYFQYYKPQFARSNEAIGHYEKTDTWSTDVDYSCQTHKWVPDEPPILAGTWFVKIPSGEIDYWKSFLVNLFRLLEKR